MTKSAEPQPTPTCNEKNAREPTSSRRDADDQLEVHAARASNSTAASRQKIDRGRSERSRASIYEMKKEKEKKNEREATLDLDLTTCNTCDLAAILKLRSQRNRRRRLRGAFPQRGGL